MSHVLYSVCELPEKLDFDKHYHVLCAQLQAIGTMLNTRGIESDTGRVTIRADYDIRHMRHHSRVEWEPLYVTH